MRLVEIFKIYLRDKPKIRKTVGVILIIVGLGALVTPFTPGSWLALIGLELLGWRILFYDKTTRLLRKCADKPAHLYNKWAGKLKFWKKKQNPNSSDLPAG